VSRLAAVLLWLAVGSPLAAETVNAWVSINVKSPEFVRFARLLDRIGQLSGLQFQLRDDLLAPRALFQLQHDELDAVIGVSPEAVGGVADTLEPVFEPFFVGHHLVISRAPMVFAQGADLKGKDVLALRGTASAAALQVDPLVHYVEAPDWRSAFQMLINKRADVLVVHETVYASYLASPEGQAGPRLSVAATPYMVVNNLIWFRKALASLVPRVDKALKTLKATGEYDALMRGH